MRWYLKAAVQRAIGALPNAHVVNEWFQTHVTRSLDLDDAFIETKLREARGHLERHRAHGAGPLGTAVEIGTGWYPVIPLALWLAGADRVVTYDISPLLTAERACSTLTAVQDYLARVPDALPEARPDRLAALASADGSGASAAAVLAPFDIVPIVGDAAASTLADGSVDLVMSTVVLEYIPYEPLVALLRASQRLTGPGGVHSHEIDLSDQFHYGDASITPLNFLRFSDATWALVTNDIIPQSRLRFSDYVRAFEDAGLGIADAQVTRAPNADLDRTPLAERFQTYAPDDLRVTRAWVTATAAAAPLPEVVMATSVVSEAV